MRRRHKRRIERRQFVAVFHEKAIRFGGRHRPEKRNLRRGDPILGKVNVDFVNIGNFVRIRIHIPHVEIEEILPPRQRDILYISEIGFSHADGILENVTAEDVVQTLHQRVGLHHVHLDFDAGLVLFLVVLDIFDRISAHNESEFYIRLHVVRTISLMADECLQPLCGSGCESAHQHE